MGINLSDVLMSAGDGARITVFTPEGDVLVDRMLCSEIPHIRIANYVQNQVIWQAGNDGVLYIRLLTRILNTRLRRMTT